MALDEDYFWVDHDHVHVRFHVVGFMQIEVMVIRGLSSVMRMRTLSSLLFLQILLSLHGGQRSGLPRTFQINPECSVSQCFVGA